MVTNVVSCRNAGGVIMMVTLMIKHAPEWVRTSDLMIRSPSHYLWATAPAESYIRRSSV